MPAQFSQLDISLIQALSVLTVNVNLTSKSC